MFARGSAVAAVALLAGCGGPDPTAESLSELKTTHQVQVRSLSTGEFLPRTKAKIIRDTRRGISEVEIDSRGLPAGHVILATFVVFNDPSACTVGNPVTQTPCGPGDLGNAATGASVQFISGGVAGPKGEFEAEDGIRFPFGDTSRCYATSGPPPCRQGVTNVVDSEVHLVLRDKGPLIPERFEEQSTTFFGGCDVYACSLLQAGQFIP